MEAQCWAVDRRGAHPLKNAKDRPPGRALEISSGALSHKLALGCGLMSHPPTSLSLVLGAKQTYNGTNMIECNGTNDGPRWGYSRCAVFTALDQTGAAIVTNALSASETVPTVSSNPAGLRAKVGGGSLVNGTFQDFWSFVAVSSPAPQPGQFVKARQTITLTNASADLTYPSLRINCLDFESSDVTATDITSAGTCQ
jgi:hypothetical protein